MKLLAPVVSTLLAIGLAAPGAVATSNPCPSALEDPRGFIACHVTLKERIPITTSAAAAVHQTFNDRGQCVIIDATATVNARGIIMSYDWAVAWTIVLEDGTVVEGPSASDEHDTRAVINEVVTVQGLRLSPGDSISAGSAIANNDLALDGDSASQGWTCTLDGLVQDALSNILNV